MSHGATQSKGNIGVPSSVSPREPQGQVYLEAIANQEGDENIGDGLEDMMSDDYAGSSDQRGPKAFGG